MIGENKLSYKCLYGVTILNFINSLIAVPAGFFMASFTSKIVEQAIQGKTNDVIKISLYFASFIISYQVISLILNVIKEGLAAKSKQKFKLQIYDGFLEQELSIIKRLGTGKVIENLTNDISKVIELCTIDSAKLISGIIMATSYLVFIGLKDFLLAIILLIIGLIQLIAPIIVQRFMIQNYNKTRDIEAELTDYIIDGYKGMSTIKLYNLSKYYIQGLSKIHKNFLKIGIRSVITAESENAMDNAIEALLKFGTYAIVGYLILKNKTTVAVGVSTIVLSGGLFSSMKTIFTSVPQIAVGKEAVNRLEALSLKQETVCKENNKRNKSCNIENESNEKSNKNLIIKAIDLCFSYEDKEVLKAVSFEIVKGEIVVIEGANGAGKSTLLNILLGLYDNYKGEIYIKGKNLKEISKNEYYDKVSYLAQDEIGFAKSPLDLFSMLENEGQVDYKDALKLAKSLNINDEVLKNNIIKNLSGGEKKKVYIIACLLKKGDIIFLDEPGNSLDAKAKEMLKNSILTCGKTVIMITHDGFFKDIATCNIKVNAGQITINKRGCAYAEEGSTRCI